MADLLSKLQKNLEWANLGLTVQQRGSKGNAGGGVIGEGCGSWGGMSLKRSRLARKGFEGGIMVEVAVIVFVSLNMHPCTALSLICPRPTSPVPIFSLD